MLNLNVYFWEGKRKNAGKPSDMILPLFMNSAKISKLLLMHFSIVRFLMFFFHIDQPCISPHPKEKTLPYLLSCFNREDSNIDHIKTAT